MKTQVSQQNTPKAASKYSYKESYQQRTPLRQDNFLNLYEKYLNCQGRKRSHQMDEARSPLQQSTSLHYLNKKNEVGVHRFSLDNFNLDKSSKGLKSYLTTINSSNSILNQKANNSYFPNKNDSSQVRSQTADGQSVLTDEIDKKPIKDKFIIDVVCKTKRLAEKLQQMNKQNQKMKESQNLAFLLKGHQQKKQSFTSSDLKKVLAKTKIILENYKRENKLLIEHNLLLNDELLESQDQLRQKNEEIQRLRQMLYQQ
ncbi:unnamed protein product [Paramecium primaurelia]|uniref:Uncharacterized protein n=2 Tax=Paramecium TaxID=5884 RepID=A0A8S1UTS0_9CILI|nr:unnamed protein product [Paramecium primaurelia]CAD8165866.1 unnamed protein product [Paramecium pentaurelia]